MALVYRAIWSDSSQNVCELVQAYSSSWIKQKSNGALSAAQDGHSRAVVMRNGNQVDLEADVESATGTDSVPSAYRAILTETSHDGVRWQTTIRAWNEDLEGSDPLGWLWVDLEVVGDVNLQRLAPASPRLVRELLDAGTDPQAGPTPLASAPRWYRGAEAGTNLAETISDFDRVLPIVVFVEDGDRFAAIRQGTYSFADVVSRAARQVAGIAATAVVDTEAAKSLTEALGEDHGVWNGAFRIYLKDVDPATTNDGWRHRYVTADRYMGSRNLAAAIIANRLGLASAIARPPSSFNAAKALLKASHVQDGTDDADLLELAESEIDDLRIQLQEAEEDKLGQVVDYEVLLEEKNEIAKLADELKRRLDHALGQLRDLNAGDSYWETESQNVVPFEASNPSDAVRKAHEHLSDRLIIPEAALRDVEDLDSAVTAGAWGQRSWEAFRALHAYATDMANEPGTKDFWNWCKNSGNPLAWRATSSKLAMQESDSVSTRTKFYMARCLPVAKAIAPSGTIYMDSHIKIATGGGNLAPRIYFHVDQTAARVHVGFFGPHKYMPNTKT